MEIYIYVTCFFLCGLVSSKRCKLEPSRGYGCITSYLLLPSLGSLSIVSECGSGVSCGFAGVLSALHTDALAPALGACSARI